MAKKEKARDRNKNEIDNIAKYSQQRRSPGGSKRRTDFSPFFSSPSTPPDLVLESASSKETLSTVLITSSDEISDTRMNNCEISLDRSEDEGSDSARTLEFTHKKSQKTEESDVCVTPDGPDCSNHLDQSRDKGTSSSSSRAGSYNTGRGRSKRERKPIARFDEMTYPLKSVKKVRRIKIMRLLGLAAPVGSPFQTPDNLCTKLFQVIDDRDSLFAINI